LCISRQHLFIYISITGHTGPGRPPELNTSINFSLELKSPHAWTFEVTIQGVFEIEWETKVIKKMGKLVKKFKSGAISATIWENEGKPLPNGQPSSYLTVTITRTYKKDDEWKDTNSFRVRDLPDVDAVSRASYEFLQLSSPTVNVAPQPAASVQQPAQQQFPQQ
jgi:hypothetical protein